MRYFPSGTFATERMSSRLRAFSPMQAAETLVEVDLKVLADSGKKLVLLDLDNTMLPWRSEEIPQSTIDWIAKGKALGLVFCILSNTHKVPRLARLSAAMDIPYVRSRFKPSPRMYLQAVRDFRVERGQAIMIGDQILTDILGANRAGIDAIWVRPMSTNEFIGTRLVNRMIERVVRLFLYRHLEKAEGAEEVPFLPLIGPFKYKVFRQFAKFTVVGGSSFIIDTGLHYVLMFVITVGGVHLGEWLGTWLLQQWPAVGPWLNYQRFEDYGSPILKIPTAGIAIINSFIWNRKWTFKIRDRHNRHKQFAGFVVWSVLGMVLNVLILSAVSGAIPGHGKRSWAIGTAVATIVVALWNFLGQKFVLFKAKEPRP